MKRIILIVALFISINIFAQSVKDQAVFNDKIWKSVDVSGNEFVFYDKNDAILGSKVVHANTTIYKDKWKREIKRYNKSVVSNTTSKKKDTAKEKVGEPIKNSDPARIDLKRNKAVYYDEKGGVLRTLKRRGNKIIFHNSKGKIVGYKYYNGNGTYTYQDGKRRLTGTSYINSRGVLIFTAHKRRTTAQFMLEDPFFMRR